MQIFILAIVAFTLYYIFVVKKELKKEGFNSPVEKLNHNYQQMLTDFEYEKNMIIKVNNISKDYWEFLCPIHIDSSPVENYADFIAKSVSLSQARKKLDDFEERIQKFLVALSQFKKKLDDFQNIILNFEKTKLILEQVKLESNSDYSKKKHADNVAYEFMQKLNHAYLKMDSAQMTVMLESSLIICLSLYDFNEDKQLRTNVVKVREEFQSIKTVIERIQSYEEFQIIKKLDDWRMYCEELEQAFEREKEKFEIEMKKIISDNEHKSNDSNIPKTTIKYSHYSEEFAGMVVDPHNIVDIVQENNALYIYTKYDYDRLIHIYDFKTKQEASDDCLLYKNILLNPESAVILIKKNGEFRAYDNNSNVFRELMSGITVVDGDLENVDETTESEQHEYGNQNTYARHIKSIENPSFEKIRRYCNNLVDDHKADEMQKYLAENGKMHKALMYDALEQFLEKLDGDTIALIDWGCGQGIGSMLVLDYIREKQLDIKIEQVLLIDSNKEKLSRSMLQLEALAKNHAQITAVKNDQTIDALQRIETKKTLNIIVNDIISVDITQIASQHS